MCPYTHQHRSPPMISFPHAVLAPIVLHLEAMLWCGVIVIGSCLRFFASLMSDNEVVNNILGLHLIEDGGALF